jgi:hypothetical protein
MNLNNTDNGITMATSITAITFLGPITALSAGILPITVKIQYSWGFQGIVIGVINVIDLGDP